MEKERLNKNEIFKIILMIYFMISPIFDIVYFYNHFTTFFRVICIIVFLIATLVIYKDSRKNFKYLLAYYLAMGGYLIVSFIHSNGFTSLVPGNFNYSVVSEAMTLIKLSMPFTILFILKEQKFSKEDYFKVINVWVFLIAGSIVVLNLCGWSLSSYTDQFTNYSIFSWRRGLDMRLTATKGLFMYSNQEAAILLMLLIMSIYEFLYINKKYLVHTVLVCLALLMLGTRVSTYGGLVVLIFVAIFYICYNLFFKKQIYKKVSLLAILVFLWILILPITPNSFRVQEIENVTKGKSSASNIDIVFDEDLLFIEHNINRNLVGEQFYKDFYPYKNDMEFWRTIIEKQGELKLNYRTLEIMIIDRVWKIDDRKTDYLYGISNSRIQNIVNIERDFVLQYYAFGIVGAVLALAFYIYVFKKLIIETFKKLEFVNFMTSLCFCVFVIAAFLTGNILNFLSTIIPCAYIVCFIGKYKDC